MNPTKSNSNKELAAQLIGTWKLKKMVIVDPEGNETPYVGHNPMGYLSYDTQGNMSAQFLPSDREKFSTEDFKAAPLQEAAQAFHSYQAYFGTYTINFEEEYVTHHVEGALIPNWTGMDEVRYFKIEGKKLLIHTPPIVLNGVPHVFHVVWEKD